MSNDERLSMPMTTRLVDTSLATHSAAKVVLHVSVFSMCYVALADCLSHLSVIPLVIPISLVLYPLCVLNALWAAERSFVRGTRRWTRTACAVGALRCRHGTSADTARVSAHLPPVEVKNVDRILPSVVVVVQGTAFNWIDGKESPEHRVVRSNSHLDE